MSSFRTVRLTGRSRARRIRERLLRSPVLYWCGVAVLALFTAVAVRDATTGHEAQRSVVVARRDLAAGEPLAENTERRTVPAALVPAGALEHVDPALRSTEAIAAGEIIIERRTSAAPSALAATLADDTAALAVADAADPGALPLAVGDRVDLYGVDPAGAVTRLTAGAEVVGLDGAVVVAVPQEAVADVLEARLAATLALAVRNR